MPSRRLVVCRCSIAICQLLCVAPVMRWTRTQQVNHVLQVQPKTSVGEARGSRAYAGRIRKSLRWEAQVSRFSKDHQSSHVCQSTMPIPASSTRGGPDPVTALGSSSAPVHSPWVVRVTFGDIIHELLKPSRGFCLHLESSETHLYGWRGPEWPALPPPNSAVASLPLPWLSFLFSFQPLFLQYPCLQHRPRSAPSHPSGQSPSKTPLSPSLLPLSKAEILPHCLPLSFWSVSCLFPPYPSLAVCN